MHQSLTKAQIQLLYKSCECSFVCVEQLEAAALCIAAKASQPVVCAGISRDSLHKRRLTGGKQKKWRKKRK